MQCSFWRFDYDDVVVAPSTMTLYVSTKNMKKQSGRDANVNRL